MYVSICMLPWQGLFQGILSGGVVDPESMLSLAIPANTKHVLNGHMKMFNLIE